MEVMRISLSRSTKIALLGVGLFAFGILIALTSELVAFSYGTNMSAGMILGILTALAGLVIIALLRRNPSLGEGHYEADRYTGD